MFGSYNERIHKKDERWSHSRAGLMLTTKVCSTKVAAPSLAMLESKKMTAEATLLWTCSVPLFIACRWQVETMIAYLDMTCDIIWQKAIDEPQI